uniref:Partner of Nob1 n=1 Tax=Arundo donax TaxID=35708 RepID=A0A0A9F8I0_ARUDO
MDLCISDDYTGPGRVLNGELGLASFP